MHQISTRHEKFSVKIAIIILLTSLFSNSVLAAPDAAKTILVTVDQTYQDIRFAYLSASFGSVANNLLLFFTGKHSRQDAAQISRIEIVPGGDLTIKQHEPVNFAAFGYDSEGHRIGRLRFRWTIQDIGRNHQLRE